MRSILSEMVPVAVLCATVAVHAGWARDRSFGIVDVGGVPRFAVDGKPMTATAVMPSPAGKPGAAFGRLKEFRDVGVMISSDVWTMHDKRYNPRQWWLGDGEYDFVLFDAIAKGLTDAFPDGFIFPRIKIDPPAKWSAEHREEMLDELSPRPESKAWRELCRRMFKDVIAHVEASSYAGNVIGYHIGAFHCGEWLTGDLRSGSSACISQRAEAVADFLIDAASCVKELTGGKRLVGAFFGYSGISHEKFMRAVRSGKVDFFAGPPVYFAVREPGGSGRSQAYYQASYRLHGRVCYEETDFRTFLSNPAFSPSGATRRRPLDETIGIIRRSIGKCLAGGWENWWFLLGGNDTFSDPAMMETIRIGAQEERDTLFTARWSPAEVAVFTAADEYLTSSGSKSREMRDACKQNLHRSVLPFCGVPFDSYELSDIADPQLPDYKVYMFPNAFSLDDATRAKIAERVRRPGKTAVWLCRAPEGFEERAAGAEGWRSAILPIPTTPAALRAAFREAGAHVWMDTDDVIAAGRGYLMVHAASDGVKTIRLPARCDAREIFQASQPRDGVTSISERMKLGETRVFRVTGRPSACNEHESK